MTQCRCTTPRVPFDARLPLRCLCRFALIAAFLKITCTILLIIVSACPWCVFGAVTERSKFVCIFGLALKSVSAKIILLAGAAQIIAVRTTAAGIELGCPTDCDAPTTLPSLDACCLKQFWMERSRYSWLSFAFDFVEFTSAFMFITPILALADVWGRRLTSNKLMLSAFVCSAGISLLEFLFRAGMVSTSNWLASWAAVTDYTTDPEPIKMLTISYFLVNGQTTWAFAADDLFLGIGLLTASFLTWRYGQLPITHAWIGAATGVLSVVNFILELARFGEWSKLSLASSIVYAIVGFVLLPIWLIYLACFLGQYTEPGNRASLTGDMHLPGGTPLAGTYSDADEGAGLPSGGRGLASKVDLEDEHL